MVHKVHDEMIKMCITQEDPQTTGQQRHRQGETGKPERPRAGADRNGKVRKACNCAEMSNDFSDAYGK